MNRFAAKIEYDGTPFVGWQRQKTGLSVQERLEQALAALTGENAQIHAAGRTDSGVHARGQVIHFDLAQDFPIERLREAINFHLRPDPIAVLAATKVGEDFHARFSATKRCYLYRIINRRPSLVLDRDRAWLVNSSLDVEAMAAAAALLVGRHDFTTFRASLCQARSPVKTLERLEVVPSGEELLIHAAAPSFLHHQVRNMVGSLVLVGRGKWQVETMEAALAARDRTKGGPTAPAHGLYLIDVEYGSARIF